jgi:hypothetical protein
LFRLPGLPVNIVDFQMFRSHRFCSLFPSLQQSPAA